MRNYVALLYFIVLFCGTASAQSVSEAKRAMRDEIKRSLSELSIEGLQKPYYIDYSVTHRTTYGVKAVLGSLLYSRALTSASATVGLRVGSSNFDNTNYFDVSLGFFGSADDEESFRNRRVPIELDYTSLRRELWLATDACYKQSAELYAKKEAAIKNRLRTDTLPDFITLPGAVLADTARFARFDQRYFEALTKDMSAIFSQYPFIHGSSAGVEYMPEQTIYVNSEGREYVKNEAYIGLEVVASTQANDGMFLANTYTCYARTPQDLPSRDSLLKAVEQMAKTLEATRSAPKLEDSYSGPILFEGQAAAEIFGQMFTSNLVAQRPQLTERGVQDDDRFGAFQQKIGGRVLPEFLSVEAIPQKTLFDKTTLCGSYSIDDEGMPSKNVSLIESGYLKTLLSSRVPTKRIRESNGHQRGGGTIMSTLAIQTAKNKALSSADLRKKMMKFCKDRSLPFGIIVRKILNQNILYTVLFSQTSGEFSYSQGPGKATLLEVVKVYPDGKEEIVRGAEGAGFVVQTFKDIVATGKKQYAYNYLAPAVVSPFMTGGSQYVISSLIVPDILFEDGEILPIKGDFPKPPLLPSPQAQK